MYGLAATLALLGTFFLANPSLRRLPAPDDANEAALGLGAGPSP